ncbi:hypothetical protein [Nocardia sp. NBC_00511]|uniref:hypothetical protein n=1 Tax=Nocardia sp. NBC_00511 TaxID=2903591 RepID=UPI0030E19B26
MVSAISIFPISLLGNAVLGPLLSSTPLVARTLAFTVLFSTAMTFLALPLVSWLLRGWLYPSTESAFDDERTHH